MLAAIGIGMLFTLLPWGLVADRVDERWVIATGLTGRGARSSSPPRRTASAGVTVALVGAGALGASVNAASGRAIMAWFPASELGLALGIRQTAIPIGGAVGAATLPVLASSGGTRLAFLFLAGAASPAPSSRPSSSAAARERSRSSTTSRAPCATRACGCSAPGPGSTSSPRSGSPASSSSSSTSTAACRRRPRARVLAVIYVLAIAARIGSGRISDRLGSRLGPLRTIGVALAIFTAAVAAATDAPLALLVPLFVVAGVLSMSWNGLAYAAAAEAAGAARTGAALGFQQTLLGVVVAGAPPVVAARRDPQLAARVLPRRRRPGLRRPDPAAAAEPARNPREHAERRRACRQLPELRIDAAELALAVRERRLHRRLAHRQRPAQRAHRAEALARPLRGREHLDVDLRLEHLLEAAHVRVPVLLVRVDEGTRALEARRRVDDLLAVDGAAPALRLVLRMEGKRRGRLLGRHDLLSERMQGSARLDRQGRSR